MDGLYGNNEIIRKGIVTYLKRGDFFMFQRIYLLPLSSVNQERKIVKKEMQGKIDRERNETSFDIANNPIRKRFPKFLLVEDLFW